MYGKAPSCYSYMPTMKYLSLLNILLLLRHVCLHVTAHIGYTKLGYLWA